MTALDPRILQPGMGVTVAILVDVFADHYRSDPATPVCPGCGHRFPNGDNTSDCPTLTVVRPLLRRRRFEDRKAVDRLTKAQRDNLDRNIRTPSRRKATRPAVEPALFDITPLRRTRGLL